MIEATFQRPCRRGFTLLELLLVLALLVVVLAITVMSLESTLGDQRLRKSGDQLRTQMGKARVRAMRSGRIHALWVEPSGSKYRIEPLITGDEATETGPASLQGLAGGSPAADPNSLLTEETLPEGVVFYVAEAVQDSRAALVQSTAVSTAASDIGGQIPPILFYPDGTTTTVRLMMTDGSGAFVVVSLRGLTGIAQATEPLTAEELALQ